jgi:hypothetical protein
MRLRVFLPLALVVAAAMTVTSSATGGPATTVPFTWAFAGAGSTPPPADVVLTECGGVPAGMWVRGTGMWTLYEPTGKAGNIQSRASGTAVDSAGNIYTWNYHQSIQPIGNGEFSRVVDSFGLSGSGPVGGIRSHFIAIIDGTSIEDATSFEFPLVKGDPFNCDPL